MIISTDSHPNTMAAIHCVEEDNGNRMAMPLANIPARWDEFLPRIEEVLGTLSKTERDEQAEPLPLHVKPNAYLHSQFYSFCNGEFYEQTRIANRSEDHALAMLFLNDMFEDWSYTTDRGPDSVANTFMRQQIEWLEMIERESTGGLSVEQSNRLDSLRKSLTA
jgi:hypothetical protein